MPALYSPGKFKALVKLMKRIGFLGARFILDWETGSSLFSGEWQVNEMPFGNPAASMRTLQRLARCDTSPISCGLKTVSSPLFSPDPLCGKKYREAGL
jgi:hypothetical protein